MGLNPPPCTPAPLHLFSPTLDQKAPFESLCAAKMNQESKDAAACGPDYVVFVLLLLFQILWRIGPLVVLAIATLSALLVHILR